MKKCKECDSLFSTEFRNANSIYCSEDCRKEVRRKTNKGNRAKRKKLMQGNDVDYISKQIFKKYQSSAKKRKLFFDLSLDFFVKNFRVDCFYCGDQILNVGFDRIDNTKGYTEDNSVPCCTDCNLMKRNYSLDEFIMKCRKINKMFP